MSDQKTDRTYTWNGQTHPIGKPHLTDVEMAGEVRMLMRDQLNHEAICTAARDRIMCLVAEKEALKERIQRMIQDREYIIGWTDGNDHAQADIKALETERDELARMLRKHHEWHQTNGLEMKLGEDYFDCASLYVDSAFEKETSAALAGGKVSQ